MAASPKYKIFSSDDEYRGSAKYAEDAAAFAGSLGVGATIRLGHAKSDIVAVMDDELVDSVDETACVIHDKEDLRKAQSEAKRKRFSQALWLATGYAKQS